MLITNGQLVDMLLEKNSDVNELFRFLSLSMALLKKYKKILFTDDVLGVIQTESVGLYQFLKLLKSTKKNSAIQIKTIISLLKKRAENYDKSFTILSDSQDHQLQIKGFLENRFAHLQVSHHVLEGEQISVAGEGWYYKRDLEQDVKKLLGL